MRDYKNHEYRTFGASPSGFSETLYVYPDGSVGAGASPDTMPTHDNLRALHRHIFNHDISEADITYFLNSGRTLESIYQDWMAYAATQPEWIANGVDGVNTQPVDTIPRPVVGADTTNKPVDTSGDAMPASESKIFGFPTKTVLIVGGVIGLLTLTGSGK